MVVSRAAFGLAPRLAPRLAWILACLALAPLAACGDDDDTTTDMTSDDDDATAMGDDDTTDDDSTGDDDTTGDDDDSTDDDTITDTDDDTTTDDDDDTTPDPFYPAETNGPFNPAATAVTFTDPARKREFPATVWYPTEATEGRKARYFNGSIDEGTALKNAPVGGTSKLPVIIFSHGHLGFDAQSFTMMEYLATHGYIIVAPDHIGDTILTYDPDELIPSLIDRPRDISFIIDSLEAWHVDTKNRFHDRIDLNRIGMAGHSLGALTVITVMGPELSPQKALDACLAFDKNYPPGQWFICADLLRSLEAIGEPPCEPCNVGDDRIKTFASMAPGFVESIVDGEFAKLTQPLIVMGGSEDQAILYDTQIRPFYDGTTRPGNMLWRLEGGGHYAFSDGCKLFPENPVQGCGTGFIDIDRGFELIYPAVVAWFGMTLREDSRYETYFSAEFLADKPEVSIERKQ